VEGFDPPPKEHPSALVETASLSSIIAPPTKFPLAASLAPVSEANMLSAAQLESVLTACETHSWKIRAVEGEPFRAGFALGDGAGVGKGRQVAALILDSWLRGRKRSVWFR
jgi:hypothetical protein